jgi:hypothetical protein
MFRLSRHLIFGVAALAVAGSAIAGPQNAASTPSHSHAKQSATSSTAPAAKPSAPTTLAATGKIVQFDTTAQALTLSTPKGDERFTLDSSTRLRDASHSIAPADLAKLTGHQATVRYHDASGQKSVVSVRVSSAAPEAQSKKPQAKQAQPKH